MTLSTVRLSLHIGKRSVSPAPERLMRALDSVEVQQDDGEGAGFGQGFTISFRAERGQAVREDFALLTDPLLKPGNRVVISVAIQNKPRVLMDGVITQHQFIPSSGNTAARLVITGTDLSVMMDLEEKAVPHPGMDHVAVAKKVLGNYAKFGVKPNVAKPKSSWKKQPNQAVPFQRSTDLQYLRELAKQHGFVFGIKPGQRPGQSIGYWGPLIRARSVQQPLNVDMGNATNVKSIQFSNDSLKPEQMYGFVHQRDKKKPAKILVQSAKDPKPLSRKPAIKANQPFVKKRRLDYRGDDVAKAKSIAQGRVDLSSANTVTANGTIDVLRYRDLLFAPGIVPLRGAGASYDGHYYVRTVSHSIQNGAYTQSFTLAREGTVSKTKRVST